MLPISVRDKLRMTVAVAILASMRDDETCTEATERIIKSLKRVEETSAIKAGQTSKPAFINYNNMGCVTRSLLASLEFNSCHHALGRALVALQQSLERPELSNTASLRVNEAIVELARVLSIGSGHELRHSSVLELASSLIASVRFLRVSLCYFGASLDSPTLQQIGLQAMPTMFDALLRECVAQLLHQSQPATRDDPSAAGTLADLLMIDLPEELAGESAAACALVVEQHTAALASVADNRSNHLPDQVILDMIALYSTILSHLLSMSTRSTLKTSTTSHVTRITPLEACVLRSLRYLRRSSILPHDDDKLLQLEWELIQQCSGKHGWTVFEKGHV